AGAEGVVAAAEASGEGSGSGARSSTERMVDVGAGAGGSAVGDWTSTSGGVFAASETLRLPWISRNDAMSTTPPMPAPSNLPTGPPGHIERTPKRDVREMAPSLTDNP